MILQEFYADFIAVEPYHFTLNIPSNHLYMLPAVVDPSSLQHYCDRVVDGIAAVFLALKRRPVIKYQRTSDIAKRIAQETAVSRIPCSKDEKFSFMCWAGGSQSVLWHLDSEWKLNFYVWIWQKLMYEQESGLFDFRRTEISPLLLVLDRRDDPVTTLLNQWTYQVCVIVNLIFWVMLLSNINYGFIYCWATWRMVAHWLCCFLQAMVHELIGIQDNKVDLRNMGNLPKDQQVHCIFPYAVHVYYELVSIFILIFMLTGGCAVIWTRCLLQSEHVWELWRYRNEYQADGGWFSAGCKK